MIETYLKPNPRTREMAGQNVLIDFACRSDIGLKRELNEDYCFAGVPLDANSSIASLFMVSDGMGGHEAGDVASKVTCEFLEHLFARGGYLRFAQEHGIPPSDFRSLLEAALRKINRKVVERANSFHLFRTMGCTCTVGLLICEAGQWSLVCGSIGDSRCYIVRDQDIFLITEDDSYVWEMYRRKEISYAEMRTHPKRNVLTQAIGINEEINPKVVRIDIEPNDIVLLCSDGLHGLVPDQLIKRILRTSDEAQTACKRLVEAANEAGGRDNISVVTSYCLKERPVEEKAQPRKKSGTKKMAWIGLPLALFAAASFILSDSLTVAKTDGGVAYNLSIGEIPQRITPGSLVYADFSVEPSNVVRRSMENYAVVRMINQLRPDTIPLIALKEKRDSQFEIPLQFKEAATHRVRLMLLDRASQDVLSSDMISVDVKNAESVSITQPKRTVPAGVPTRTVPLEERMFRFSRGQDGSVQIWLSKDQDIKSDLSVEVAGENGTDVVVLTNRNRILPKGTTVEYKPGSTLGVRIVESNKVFQITLK